MKDHTAAKLRHQVSTLTQTVVKLTHELELTKRNVELLAKVAHYHGEPEVAAKVNDELDKSEQGPNWVKKEFKPEEVANAETPETNQ